MIIYKNLIFCVLVSLSTVSFPQQLINRKAKKERTPTPYPFIKHYASVGLGYEMSVAFAKMKEGMNLVHSLNLSGAVPLNFISRNMEAGLNLGYGVYAIQSFGLNYQISNNHVNTGVDYTSSMINAAAAINYYFNRRKKFQPFVGVRAGYTSLMTSFFVEDPRDPTSCLALDQDVVQSDGIFTFGYGTGFRVFTGSALGSERNFIEFSANILQGGRIDYVNATNIKHHQQPFSTNESAVNVDFVNPANNNIHKHSIAEVYSNSLRLVQMRVSYVLHFRLR
jgi:hypothetical protein